MNRPATLALGLDGYEPSVGDRLMAEGRLPNLKTLRDRSARFRLDHGDAKRSGLAWEHVSLGQRPEAYARWAAVSFDPDTYRTVQQGTTRTPFVADLPARAVIFDAPYFDLAAAPNCRGIVSWGAHDPGIAPQSVPSGLTGEIAARFGPYPADAYIYGMVWADPEEARRMADALVRAVDTRGEITQWLLGERLPDWDLALVVVSEFHSALEALWHGIDPAHPLYGAPSAGAARDGIVGVYEATDRMVGALCRRFPDHSIVLFSMHGMGANDSDVATMLLLPDLLHRAAFRQSLFVPRVDWAAAHDGNPALAPGENWSDAVMACLREGAAAPPRPAPPSPLVRILRRLGARGRPAETGDLITWMPATRYHPFWPRMDAFALPSFYDGRVRVNLAGRERLGRVELGDYQAKCAEIAALLRACRNPRTGEPVVRVIETPVAADPLRAAPTQADLIVTWRGAPLGLVHPDLGLVGPAPYRRTGGHSGGHGLAYVAAPGVEPGDYGIRSSFDVVPTLIGLLGMSKPAHLTGESLL